MHKCIKGALLGAVAGATVTGIRGARGDEATEAVGTRMLKAAAGGAVIGGTFGWLLEVRDRRKLVEAAAETLHRPLVGVGALAESARPHVLAAAESAREQALRAAETARDQALRAAETARPHVLAAADAAREQALRAAETARPHVAAAADAAREQALRAAETARPHVVAAADAVRERAVLAAEASRLRGQATEPGRRAVLEGHDRPVIVRL